MPAAARPHPLGIKRSAPAHRVSWTNIETEMHDRLQSTSSRPKPLSSYFRSLAPVLLPLFFVVGTGLWGLDFGLHWDEKHYQIGPVRTMIETGIPLPKYYGYPSFDYRVNAAVVLPDVVPAEITNKAALKHQLLRITKSQTYLLRLRAVYLVIASLSVLWVYLLVIAWHKSRTEALLASMILAFSWEIAYHSRWFATDGMLMQF